MPELRDPAFETVPEVIKLRLKARVNGDDKTISDAIAEHTPYCKPAAEAIIRALLSELLSGETSAPRVDVKLFEWQEGDTEHEVTTFFRSMFGEVVNVFRHAAYPNEETNPRTWMRPLTLRTFNYPASVEST